MRLIVVLYIGLGIFAGGALFSRANLSATAIMYLALFHVVLFGLAALGFVQGRKNGRFLRFSHHMWIAGPLACYIFGLIIAYMARPF